MNVYIFSSRVVIVPTIYIVLEHDLQLAWEALAKELQTTSKAAKATYRFVRQIPVKSGGIITLSDAGRHVTSVSS